MGPPALRPRPDSRSLGHHNAPRAHRCRFASQSARNQTHQSGGRVATHWEKYLSRSRRPRGLRRIAFALTHAIAGVNSRNGNLCTFSARWLRKDYVKVFNSKGIANHTGQSRASWRAVGCKISLKILVSINGMSKLLILKQLLPLSH